MIIREIKPEDTEAYMELVQKIDQETEFMLAEPGERVRTPATVRKIIQELKNYPNQTIFLAEQSGFLLGYLVAHGSKFIRKQHSGFLAIGVLKAFHNKGIGTKLFEAMDEWAIKNKLRRIELGVIVTNENAIHLYKKMGFKIEGTRKDSVRINGKYIDEYMMAKIY